MLVLSRRRNEIIRIGDDITITLVDIKYDGTVRLGIDAPKTTSIHRQEVYEAIQREERERQERSRGVGAPGPALLPVAPAPAAGSAEEDWGPYGRQGLPG